MEIIIIVAGLVIGLIVVLGKMEHAKTLAETAEKYEQAIIEQEQEIAKQTKRTIERADLPTVIDEFNGLFPNKDQND